MRLQLYRGTYSVYWREDGKPIRRSLGTSDESEGKRRFEDFRRGLAANETARLHTVADLWEARRRALEGRRMATNMRYSGLPVLAFFGHLRPHMINEEMVRSYIRERNKAPGTVWTDLNHLRSTLTWAHKTKLIGEVPYFPLPSRPPPKTDYLTKEQARAFIEGCRFPHIRLFTLLALATGARAGALLELTWDRVDLDRRLIHLRTEQMANKKGRAIVPINDMLLEALVAAKATTNHAHVIHWVGDQIASVKRGIKQVAVETKLPFVSPHVFRHSAAVWMAEAGVPMDEIAQYLGHSNIDITRKVYARFSPDYLKKAAKALEL
jgi:integrase